MKVALKHTNEDKAPRAQRKRRGCAIYKLQTRSGSALVATRAYRAKRECKSVVKAWLGCGQTVRRFHCAGGTLLSLLPRFYYVYEFHIAILLRFYCASSQRRFHQLNFDQDQNKSRELVIVSLYTMLLLQK